MPPGPQALRESYADTLFPSVVRGALARLNPELPVEARDDAFRKLTRPEGSTLPARNRAFHRMAVDGVTVEYRDERGAIRGAPVRVFDFERPSSNGLARREPVHRGRRRARTAPDLVLFVNGLPLAVIEIKNPADEEATVRSAWQQLRTYQAELPSLFAFNAVLAVSDGVEARLGTLSAGWEWFKPWRTISGEELAPVFLTQLQVLIEGCSRSGASRTSFATSSCSRMTAADDSPRRWRGITSFTRSRRRSARRCARRSCGRGRSLGATNPDDGRAAAPATGASGSCGTPRAPARA